MANSTTVPASSSWTPAAASAATTSLATTIFPSNFSTTSASFRATHHDQDPSYRQRHAERALRRAPRLGLHVNPPPPNRPAPPRHAHRLRYLLPLPGLLSCLSLASWLRPLPPRRQPPAHPLLCHLDHPHHPRRLCARPRHRHAPPRPRRPLRQASPDRPLDPPHLALRQHHRRRRLPHALPPVTCLSHTLSADVYRALVL